MGLNYNFEEYLKIIQLVSRTKQGDTNSAKNLLLTIATDLRSGKTLPSEVEEWLAAAFEEIANAPKPHANLSLGVTLGRGKSGMNVDIKYNVLDFIYYSQLPLHSEPGGAYYAASQKYPVSSSAAQKIYEAYYKEWREDCKIEHNKIEQEIEAGINVCHSKPPF